MRRPPTRARSRVCVLVCLVGLLAIAHVSGAQASGSETVARHYDLAAGVSPPGVATSAHVCAPGDLGEAGDLACLALRDEEGNGFEVGVALITSSQGDSHGSVVVSVSDDNFDSTFLSVCLFLGADDVCNAGDVRVTGCDSVTIPRQDVKFGGDDHPLDAFVYTAHLEPDSIETCFGSMGDVTAIFD